MSPASRNYTPSTIEALKMELRKHIPVKELEERIRLIRKMYTGINDEAIRQRKIRAYLQEEYKNMVKERKKKNEYKFFTPLFELR